MIRFQNDKGKYLPEYRRKDLIPEIQHKTDKNRCTSRETVKIKNGQIRNKGKKNGEHAGARTLDHRLKRAMLYRLSY